MPFRRPDLRPLCSCGFLLATAPAVADPAVDPTLFQAADYRSQQTDINGDGRPDVLLRPRPAAVVAVTDDTAVPIPLPSGTPTLLFRSKDGGDYALDPQPPATELHHRTWSDPAQPSHDLIFPDSSGAALPAGAVLLIRARSIGGPHFLVSVRDPAAPRLMQALSSAKLGVELGGAGTLIEFRDRNDDGRPDLLVRPALTAPSSARPHVFIARPDGTFVPDVQGELYSVWQGLLDALAVPDVDAALSYVDDSRDETYRREFRQIGDEIRKFPRHVGNPRPIDIQPEYAEFVILQKFPGENGGEETGMHFISFVRQDDAWVLYSF